MNCPKIAREGWSRIFVIFTASVVSTILFGSFVSIPLWIILLLTLQFFRDPDRSIPDIENGIVSPAHGKVVSISQKNDPFTGEKTKRISIFMNIFSVHSNRIPISGRIKNREHFQGQFLNASIEKASDQNERCAIQIETRSGSTVSCVQIAGLVARRILTYVNIGDHVSTGERYGFIRFGSRVDVFLPLDSKIVAPLGKWVTSGSDIIAFLPKDTDKNEEQ